MNGLKVLRTRGEAGTVGSQEEGTAPRAGEIERIRIIRQNLNRLDPNNTSHDTNGR